MMTCQRTWNLAPFLLLVAGCEPSECGPTPPCDTLPSAFTPPPGALSIPFTLADMDLSRIGPEREVDYWEFRQIGNFVADTGVVFDSTVVLAAGGRVSRSAIGPELLARLDGLAWENVFSAFCQGTLFGGCGYFFAAVVGESIQVWGSPPEVAEFLSPIDTEAEAVILAFAARYFSPPSDPGGVWPEGDGFDLVLSLVTTDAGFCDTRRVLLHVDVVGSIRERDSVLLSRQQLCPVS